MQSNVVAAVLRRYSLTALVSVAALNACSNASDPVPSGIAQLTGVPAEVVVGQGHSTTAHIGFTRTGFFRGTVNLSAEGLPPGLVTSFQPAALTGDNSVSALTVVAVHSLAPGSYSFNVRASSPGIEGRTITVPVTVTIYAVAVATGASTYSVIQGSTQTIPVSITRTGGFDGQVGLSVFGLPDGMTASFEPSVLPAGVTTSLLTLSAPLTLQPGTANLSVRASAIGVADHMVPVQLTVASTNTPAIVVTPASTLLTVKGGEFVDVPISLQRFAGFDGPVSVTFDGLPPTVTATSTSFDAGSNTATVRFIVSPLETGGRSNVTIRAAGAGVSPASTVVAIERKIVASIFLSFAPYTLQSPLSASSSVTVARGNSVTVPISLTRVGVNQPVSLSIFDKPSGVLLDFPLTMSPSSTAQSFNVVINVLPNAVPGVYTLRVRGQSQTAIPIIKDATLSLTVN